MILDCFEKTFVRKYGRCSSSRTSLCLVSLIHWIFKFTKFTFVWYKLFHFTLMSCWPFITFVSCINPSNSWRVWRPKTCHSFPRLSPPNRKTVTFSCSRSLFSICSLGTLRILEGARLFNIKQKVFAWRDSLLWTKGLPLEDSGMVIWRSTLKVPDVLAIPRLPDVLRKKKIHDKGSNWDNS